MFYAIHSTMNGIIPLLAVENDGLMAWGKFENELFFGKFFGEKAAFSVWIGSFGKKKVLSKQHLWKIGFSISGLILCFGQGPKKDLSFI